MEEPSSLFHKSESEFAFNSTDGRVNMELTDCWAMNEQLYIPCCKYMMQDMFLHVPSSLTFHITERKLKRMMKIITLQKLQE